MRIGELATMKEPRGRADNVREPFPDDALIEDPRLASSFHRPLRARKAMTAWKMVMHQGLPIASAADELKTTPQRVEYMLLALARRRATRLAG